MMRIGLISDTHGLLRPEALAALRESDAIVHAGDIGDPAILTALARVAPVTAVRGNNDWGPWAAKIPDTAEIAFGDLKLFALHDLATLVLDPKARGFRVVIAGHSHRPESTWRNDVLYINPGSAGPRRFRLPVSVGYLLLDGERVESHLIDLQIG